MLQRARPVVRTAALRTLWRAWPTSEGLHLDTDRGCVFGCTSLAKDSIWHYIQCGRFWDSMDDHIWGASVVTCGFRSDAVPDCFVGACAVASTAYVIAVGDLPPSATARSRRLPHVVGAAARAMGNECSWTGPRGSTTAESAHAAIRAPR